MNVKNSINFIMNHKFQILLVIIVLFIMTSYYSISDKYSKRASYTLKRELMLEGFENEERKLFKNGFCKSLENTKELEDNCNKLVKDLCVNLDCCTYAKFKNEPPKCVASRNGEPIFKNSKKNNSLSYFIYQNKKINV